MYMYHISAVHNALVKKIHENMSEKKAKYYSTIVLGLELCPVTINCLNYQ